MEIVTFLEKTLSNPSSHVLTFVCGILLYHWLWGADMRKELREVHGKVQQMLERLTNE